MVIISIRVITERHLKFKAHVEILVVATMKDRVRLVRVWVYLTTSIIPTIITLTYPISVVFITIITEGSVIARAILAPIALILNAGSAITITVSSVVATITSESIV
jgi:hypothetical protein